MARWEREGIPHKGWKEIGIEDLGEDLESGDDVEYEQCEMCGQEKILLSFQGTLCNRYKLGTCLRGIAKKLKQALDISIARQGSSIKRLPML